MKNINTHKVSLKFFDFDYSPEELTEILGLKPTETALKGQEYFIGSTHNKIKKIWPWNFWEYQQVIEKNDHWIGDQIDDFIDSIIKPRLLIIKELTASCDSEFSIVQYLYDGCNPGLHFDNSRLKIITAIGAEIDIDIYNFNDSEKDSIKK